ncbi:helix-turn-helix domain-containing protein [uncultured Solobacterium sp.]|uniref:helix-turn-helix domain-containing protein n=1 Tax=uncultured Solobacterium sp. TaxID=747375 RepID=UPI0025DF5177|nr:helix-turn-helix domain-containing protein [uncultured Solobacterium sp.]
MNLLLLKSKMVEKGITDQELSSLLGINQATLFRKKNGTSDFYRNEIKVIKEVLELTDKDIDLIFFGN